MLHLLDELLNRLEILGTCDFCQVIMPCPWNQKQLFRFGSGGKQLLAHLGWNHTISSAVWESLYQHFWRFFKDERLVYALSYPSKYLGMHPSVCSSIFSLIPFLEFAQGVWHPEGGFRALAKAFALRSIGANNAIAAKTVDASLSSFTHRGATQQKSKSAA